MNVSQWPARDQALRERALMKGDIIDGGQGAIAAHRSATIAFLDKGNGRWLQWLIQRGELDPLARPARRVTRDRVAAYTEDLLLLNSIKTVIGRLSALYYMTRAMDPGRNLEFLRLEISRLRKCDRPVRDKSARIVDIAELYRLGLRLMQTASQQKTQRLAALQYRDGLLISMLAACPIRTKNAIGLVIGDSFLDERGWWWIRLTASVTKTNRRFEAALPIELNPYIANYLAIWRQLLLQCRNRRRRSLPEAKLWITAWGTRWVRFYDAICARTRHAFGRAVNPHLFRDCASTSIAIKAPKSVRLVMPVLGHASLKTSEDAYNHAESFEAFGQWHELLIAYHVPDRENAFGTRIGAMWPHEDGKGYSSIWS